MCANLGVHMDEALALVGAPLLRLLVVLQIRLCLLVPVGQGIEVEVVLRVCV